MCMDGIHEDVNGAADDTCLSSVRGKETPPPADASACCHLPADGAAEGTRSRGEQREAERGEDDVTLLPNPLIPLIGI